MSKVKKYIIFYKRTVDPSVFYSYVSEIADKMDNRPTYFLANCTDSQVEALNNHEDIIEVKDYKLEMSRHEEVDLAKPVTYHRRFHHAYRQDEYNFGNWGLIRHQSLYNNTSFNTTTAATYSNQYDGTGVDIILNLASVLDINDPEFMTNGVSRLQQFQWNTLSGMNHGPTIDYYKSGGQINSHAESVAYVCASNTYGWATGADLYVWPRDQHKAADFKTNTHGWDTFKLFHQQKGNNRPTIVVDAIMYVRWASTYSTSSVMFRDQIYSEIAPAGCEELPAAAYDRLILRHGGGEAYGNTINYHATAGFPLMFGDGNEAFYDLKPRAANITPEITNAIKDYISEVENAGDISYAYWFEPLEEMEAAGVHHVSAAGNYSSKICLPDNIDYNNGIITPWPFETTINGSTTFHSEFYTFEPTCRPNYVIGPNTIVAGALGSEFDVHSQFNGKEQLAPFSDRGDRVDTVAAGEGIFLNMHSNGTYDATGTSFASPNICGMAACVLQKYPTTTVPQLRKYFRDHAIGVDKLYDTGNQPVPSSNKGDLQYFANPVGLQGYSGNIAYLDPNLTFDPTTITNTTITSTETVSSSNVIDYSIAEINTILDD